MLLPCILHVNLAGRLIPRLLARTSISPVLGQVNPTLPQGSGGGGPWKLPGGHETYPAISSRPHRFSGLGNIKSIPSGEVGVACSGRGVLT